MKSNNPKPNNDSVYVTTYDDKYRRDFERLNLEWIEKYFVVEELDRLYLQNPREKIIETGGEIFFVIENEVVRGTCAMIKHDADSYELSKMAVEPGAQGRGFSNRLMTAVIEAARQKQAKKIFLVSNTRLVPALKLYEKYGFQTTRLGAFTEYQRADIEMTLIL